MSYPKQIKSVYNYPENLNPFYEDDQHKRLRFWQLSSKKKKNQPYQENGMGSRRGSFNLGSLKNLLWVKTFISSRHLHKVRAKRSTRLMENFSLISGGNI